MSKYKSKFFSKYPSIFAGISFVVWACFLDASGLNLIVNSNLQEYPELLGVQGGTIPLQLPSPLHTKVISFFPPSNKVILPIFASNLPCFASKDSTSSFEAPAISASMNIFPLRSYAGLILISDKP